MEENNIYKQTAHSIKWTGITQISRQLFQFVILIFLARLLDPSDFGIISIIVTFTGFATLLNDLGLASALIQKEVIKESHLSSVFYINFICAVLLTLFFLMVTPLISQLYDEPILAQAIPLVIITFPINSLGLVQRAVLQREMKFNVIGYLEISALFISGIVAVIFAFLEYGVWSLVWQFIINSIVTTLGVWYFSSWRPRKIFDYNALQDLWGFSVNLLSFQIFNYWIRNGDNFLIGYYLGSVPLGLYTRAYSTMLLPINQVSNVLTRVMFASFSRIQNDKVLLKKIYLQSISLIAFVTFPLMIGLFVLADKFILVFYTAEWSGAINTLRILSLVGFLQSIAATVGWIYQSQARTDLMLKWGVFSSFIYLVSFALGVFTASIEAVAFFYLISNVFLFYWNFTIPCRLIDLSFTAIISAIYRTTLCALIMGVIVYSCGKGFDLWQWDIRLQFVAQIFIGVVFYTIISLYLNRTIYSLFRNTILTIFPYGQYILKYLPV
jgi:PST family polysaccharide transporter